jgi:hypothetical protein
MLELKLTAGTVEELQMYLNGPQYHNLISDLYQSLRLAQKHGNDSDVLQAVKTFYPDLCKAFDHNLGPY